MYIFVVLRGALGAKVVMCPVLERPEERNSMLSLKHALWVERGTSFPTRCYRTLQKEFPRSRLPFSVVPQGGGDSGFVPFCFPSARGAAPLQPGRSREHPAAQSRSFRCCHQHRRASNSEFIRQNAAEQRPRCCPRKLNLARVFAVINFITRKGNLTSAGEDQ
jgi:hypothetical protein